MGDGIMALFGAPIAHEDHAVRACYAALRMQGTVKQYARTRRSQGVRRIRVGLNSGEVVVRAIGSDLHMDYTAIGQTPPGRADGAARRSRYDPADGRDLRAPRARRRHAAGPCRSRGCRGRSRCTSWSVRRPPSRFQASAARGFTRFVGRRHRAGSGPPGPRAGRVGPWPGRRAGRRARRGQVAPRLGVHPLPRTQGWLVLESGAVSYGKATTYCRSSICSGLLPDRERDDTGDPEKVTGKVLTLDRQLEPPCRRCSPCSTCRSRTRPGIALDPPQRRQRTLDGVKPAAPREPGAAAPAALRRPALDRRRDPGAARQPGRGPADGPPPAARELPARVPAQLGRQDATTVSSASIPCRPSERRRSAGRPARRRHQSRAAQADADRTHRGQPALPRRERPALVETGRWSASGAPTAWHRTARRSGCRRRCRRSSPRGSTGCRPRTSACSRRPRSSARTSRSRCSRPSPSGRDDELRQGLAHLQAAEFLYEARLFPELEYTFKHALTHEVAYGSLLQERRRALHGRILESIRRLHAERDTEQVETLAHHALKAEAWKAAVTYLRRAGIRAGSRSAHRQAVSYLEQALDTLPHLPQSRELIALSIDLRFDLRNSMHPLGEFQRILFRPYRGRERSWPRRSMIGLA